MKISLAAPLLTLLLLACGNPPEPIPDAGGPVELCHDAVDNDGDGLTDCDDPDCFADPGCQPPAPRRCTSQQNCGDIVNELVTPVCLGGTCQAPGPAHHQGNAIEANVLFDLFFGSQFSLTPAKSAVVRFLLSKKVDGSPLTCAEAVTLNGSDQPGRSQLDQNPAINQVFRMAYQINTLPGQTVVNNLLASVPKGSDFLLYTEAWSEGLSLHNPLGYRMAVDCLEGQKVDADRVHYQVRLPRN